MDNDFNSIPPLKDYHTGKRSPIDYEESLEYQLKWIRGIREQVDFANRLDVLPDFYLIFGVIKRPDSRTFGRHER